MTYRGMTYEEAIKEIRKFERCHYEKPNGDADLKVYEAVEKAIEAIEKQIPKKKHKYQGYRCICGEEVAKNQRYCEYCGQQLLDWSKE